MSSVGARPSSVLTMLLDFLDRADLDRLNFEYESSEGLDARSSFLKNMLKRAW